MNPVSVTFFKAGLVWASLMAGIVFCFWFFGSKHRKSLIILLMLTLVSSTQALTTGEIVSIKIWTGTQEITSITRLYREFYFNPVSYTSQVIQVARDPILVKLENLTKNLAAEYGITSGMLPGQILQIFKDTFDAAENDLQRFKAVDDKHTFMAGYIDSRQETPTGTNTSSVLRWYSVISKSPAEVNNVTNVPFKEFHGVLEN